MPGFSMTIDGAAAGSAAAFDVIDPATGRPYAAAPDCSREQLDAADHGHVPGSSRAGEQPATVPDPARPGP